MIDISAIRPHRDFVLVVRPDVELETSGGLYIPNAGQTSTKHRKTRSGYGHVVATGPGRFDEKGRRLASPVEPGQTVAFDPDKARIVWDQDDRGRRVEVCVFLRHDELLGVLDA